MKNVLSPNNGQFYTAKEIVEILEKARALGCTFIKADAHFNHDLLNHSHTQHMDSGILW